MRTAKEAWYRFIPERIKTMVAAIVKKPQDGGAQGIKELLGVLENSLLQRNQTAEVITDLQRVLGRIPLSETEPNAELRLCVKETIRRLS